MSQTWIDLKTLRGVYLMILSASWDKSSRTPGNPTSNSEGDYYQQMIYKFNG